MKRPSDGDFVDDTTRVAAATVGIWRPHISVIFVNENENGEKRENNEFVNEN